MRKVNPHPGSNARKVRQMPRMQCPDQNPIWTEGSITAGCRTQDTATACETSPATRTINYR
ncbi:MAG: hypothetical protein CMJ58_15235 [Planctomycetaceae bacterium]|nr:hypothetical protein [Planctomycetaceae bacterium]